MQRLGPDDSGYAISANEDLLKVLFDPSVAIMVCGHTHVPMVRVDFHSIADDLTVAPASRALL